ncbi:MAG: hypothetical protein KKD29_07630 [Candidatus Omnitrophica bacterium]|nr:hypothetical protein [Candidatus Omnitrophota bacterium]MBU4487484.1 hypothetical protein [Candidatus Omnitrophota bacterium]MCG2705130.1 glycosyltransferase [Candidatus Omnitrophota bacterium]
MKRKVHILTTYASPNSIAFLYPFLANRRFFSSHGIEFSFYETVSKKIYSCDCLFINSKFFREWYPRQQNELYDTMSLFKKNIGRVIWFDTTDSTGTTQFNIMPFVDRYYKGQLLRNRSLYEKAFYGHRIFTDYYHERFGIEDDRAAGGQADLTEATATTLKKEYAAKLYLSWSSAMNEWGSYNYTYGGLLAKIKCHLPFEMPYRVKFVKPDKRRSNDVLGRIGLAHKRDTVRYQRELITKALDKNFKTNTAKISRKEYLREIKNSKIGVSPFGLGEISCRDFEVIINGALLYKQDMSHLETWPPLYKDEKTYVSFAWDLSDFEYKLRTLLKDEDRIIRISKESQRTYEYYLYGDGRLEFCDKVMDILK